MQNKLVAHAVATFKELESFTQARSYAKVNTLLQEKFRQRIIAECDNNIKEMEKLDRQIDLLKALLKCL